MIVKHRESRETGLSRNVAKLHDAWAVNICLSYRVFNWRLELWMRCGLAQVNGVKNWNKSKRWTRCHSHERWHWLRQTEALLVRPRHSTVCWVMFDESPCYDKTSEQSQNRYRTTWIFS